MRSINSVAEVGRPVLPQAREVRSTTTTQTTGSQGSSHREFPLADQLKTGDSKVHLFHDSTVADLVLF
jgi:hypothetical protein